MVTLWKSNAFTANERDAYFSEECTICLEPFTNKAFVSDCLHHFCFDCIVSWAKVKPVCPLCIQPISGIINNVRSLDDYDIHDVLPVQTEVFLPVQTDVFDDAESEFNFQQEFNDTGTPSTQYADESMSVNSEFESSYTHQDDFSDPESCESFSEAVGDGYEDPQGSGLFYLTDEEGDNIVPTVLHSYSEEEDNSYDVDENWESENEGYYEEVGEEEEDLDNNNDEDEYEGDYEADDDGYNEEEYQDFECELETEYVLDEPEYESSNLNIHSPVNLSNNSLNANDFPSPVYEYEDNANPLDSYYYEESVKDHDEEEYDDYDGYNVKYNYIENYSDSDQDYLSNEDTENYNVYSSCYY